MKKIKKASIALILIFGAVIGLRAADFPEMGMPSEASAPQQSLELQEALLWSLLDDPAMIERMSSPERNNTLQEIHQIQQATNDPQRLKPLEEIILQSKLLDRPQKKEKTPAQIAQEKNIQLTLNYLSSIPGYQRFMVLRGYQPQVLKNIMNYLWENKLADDPKFKKVYGMLRTVFNHDQIQASINNTQTFNKEADLIQIPLADNTMLNLQVIDMATIKVDGIPLIRRQLGLDCGFHAAFNGLELYRFAQGLINKTQLEEILPNFDVNDWKELPAYTCSGESYIDSRTIDTIMKNHGLTEKDYSIIESIESLGFTTQVIPKLVISLFDPNIKHFSHIMIINSIHRDHWTVAVINKTGDTIRVYTADSLHGTREKEHIIKILSLIGETKATKPELETLASIDRSLEAIDSIQQNLTARVPHLLYILRDLYQSNVTQHPYFLRNYQEPILRYIEEQLTGTPNKSGLLSIFSSLIGQAPSFTPATGPTKELLVLLKNVVQSTELQPLPAINFNREYSTEIELIEFLLLLDIYRIKGELPEILTLVNQEQRAAILQKINRIRQKDMLDNQNAFKNLEDTINQFKGEQS